MTEALELGPQLLAGRMNVGRPFAENILTWCRRLPRVGVSYKIKPIAQTILKVDVEVLPKFDYDPKWHLKS